MESLQDTSLFIDISGMCTWEEHRAIGWNKICYPLCTRVQLECCSEHKSILDKTPEGAKPDYWIFHYIIVITLNEGSSQHGKHRRASTDSNCVTAIFFIFPLYSYLLQSKSIWIEVQNDRTCKNEEKEQNGYELHTQNFKIALN